MLFLPPEELPYPLREGPVRTAIRPGKDAAPGCLYERSLWAEVKRIDVLYVRAGLASGEKRMA